MSEGNEAKHARALAALGAAKGGRARAEALSAEERSEIAKFAAEARWGAVSTVLRATHAGVLPLGDLEIECSVLENGLRVLSTRGVTRAFGGRTTGAPKRTAESGTRRLPPFLASKSINPFIPSELMARVISPIEYRPSQGGRTAFGYEATLLPDLCKVITAADRAGKLKGKQRRLAAVATVVLEGLATVGIVALVDEVTGYQFDRARNELNRILAAYISKGLLPWTRRFPDEFFRHLYRLLDWEYREGQHKKNSHLGKLINKYVYDQLPPGVLAELRRLNPPSPSGYRRYKHHQFLTQSIGHPHLDRQIIKVLTLMEAASDRREFDEMFQKVFPKSGQQLYLALPSGGGTPGPS
jgi:P63C domain